MTRHTHSQQRDFAVPRNGVERGWLIFRRGASLVTLASESDTSLLYRAHFDGPVPHIETEGGKVYIQYGRLSLAEWARYALLWGRHAAFIHLSTALPWHIRVRDGVSKFNADIRALRLQELLVSGGASDVAIQLPRPIGSVPLRIAGGASNLTFRYPPNTAVSLRVRGGVNKLSFDAHHIGSVGGGLRLATSAYGVSADQYEIEIQGGANKVMIEPQ